MNSDHSKRVTLQRGDIVGNFRIVKLIGQGGYGDIFSVTKIGSKKMFAMKVESLNCNKQGLYIEHVFMRELQGCSFFPKLIDYGQTATHRYLVMELLGPSVSNTRRQFENHHYTMSTSLRIGIFMIKCIEAYHKAGLIHRDIKPGNFLLHTHSPNPLCLIDYGLSKRYLDVLGHPVPEQPKCGFKGTSKYASLRVHELHDASKRDDLVSWVYSMVELIDARLPWFNRREQREIYELKKAYRMRNLLHSYPQDFQLIWTHIAGLSYESEPNYDLIVSTLFKMLSDQQLELHAPFDWEYLQPEQINAYSPIPNLPVASEVELLEPNYPRPHVIDESFTDTNEESIPSQCKCLLL